MLAKGRHLPDDHGLRRSIPMPPPALPDKDLAELRLLSILHYVFAALQLLGLGFLWMHYFLMRTMFLEGGLAARGAATPGMEDFPKTFFQVLIGFYIAGGVILLVSGLLAVLSAQGLARRRNRTLSIVVAGLSCLQIPLGTVLGVFTLMVLMRDSVRWKYREEQSRQGGGSF